VSLPLRVTLVALVLGLLVDLVSGYSPFPGYGALLGLGGCAVIIVGSKWLGDRFLQRGEDYYPGEAPTDEQEDLRG
jgi:prepilin signal peptidase PulO-like enzyme (type II secretory pathway)